MVQYFADGSCEEDADADVQVKVSANDTTANYLENKLVAGSNVTLTVNNEGLDETITISATGGGGVTDVNVRVSSDDTTPGDLETKLIAGAGIAMTTQNPGANETRTIAVDATAAEITETGHGTVQAAVDDAESRLDTLEADTGLADHLADPADAHDASAVSFVPNGDIAANDVQAAIQEVRDDAATARGAYLPLAGGTMSGDIDFNYAVGAVGLNHIEAPSYTEGSEPALGTLASPTYDGNIIKVTQAIGLSQGNDSQLKAPMVGSSESAAPSWGKITPRYNVSGKITDSMEFSGDGALILPTAAPTTPAAGMYRQSGGYLERYDGTTWQKVAALVNKFDATSDPGVNDDGNDGYVVGSRIINVTDDKTWECTDATVDAANWEQTNAAGGGTDTNSYWLGRQARVVMGESATTGVGAWTSSDEVDGMDYTTGLGAWIDEYGIVTSNPDLSTMNELSRLGFTIPEDATLSAIQLDYRPAFDSADTTLRFALVRIQQDGTETVLKNFAPPVHASAPNTRQHHTEAISQALTKGDVLAWFWGIETWNAAWDDFRPTVQFKLEP